MTRITHALLLVCILVLAFPVVMAHGDDDEASDGRILFPLGANAGSPTPIAFLLTDPNNGGLPATVLDTVHERILHVFIMGEDFTTAQHLHPEEFPNGVTWQAQGQYNIIATFPQPGRYIVFGQYAIAGVTHQVQTVVDVTGNGTPLAFSPNFTRAHDVGAYTIELTTPQRVVVGKPVAFSFHISRDGQPVTDLERLFGADAHLFFTNAALNVSGHTHPSEGMHGDMEQQYRGPTLPFKETFAHAGTYALYLEFQHQGVVIPTVFHVTVEDPVPFPWRPVFIAIWMFGLVFVLALGYRFLRT